MKSLLEIFENGSSPLVKISQIRQASEYTSVDVVNALSDIASRGSQRIGKVCNQKDI